MASKRTRKRKRGQTTLDDVVNDQPSMKRIKSTRPPLLHNVAEVGSRDSRPRRVSRRRDKAFSAEPKRSINPYRLRSSSRLHSNYVSNNESTDLDAGGEDDTEVDVDIHDRGEIDESYESQHQLQPSPTTMSTKMSKEMSISQSFTPESLTSPTPKMSTMAQNISNIRSQPSTPKRSKIKKRSAKLSKSARRKSPNKRRTSRLPTEESDCESAVESDIESGLESGFEIEATSFEELDRVLKRKKTPNWKESQDSIDPEPTESAKPSEPDTPQKTPYHIIEMDDSQDTPTNHSREGYSRNRVVPVMTPMTDPVTHKYGYSGIHVPFGVHPPSYSMNLNMSHHSVHSVHSVHSSHSLRYGLNHNGSIRNNNALGPGTPRPGRYDVDDNHDNKLNKPTEDIWS